ncbi:hypothetical protein L3Q82_002382 [Scortum barcoo]|uniref:Uncharacterized protein n=1 Tax=Scortum barcoo TaxID=214431 RepID=A0ACB8VYH4_9TELE|nr:hypothetical protein L3Q82_002382 [Scortum barcoo]
MAGKDEALTKLDVGVLSAEQQEKLRQFKIKTRINNEKYLRSHPEVEVLIGDFLSDVLLKRPADIREFAAVHGMPEKTTDFRNMAKKLTTKMWNCSHISTMIKLMRNSSDSCYMQAFLAPLSWETLITQSENNINSDDYDTLLSAAKPVVQDMSFNGVNLPTKAEQQNVKKMMKLMQEVFNPMPENQRTLVAKWAKEQITQNNFNCTMKPSSESRMITIVTCKGIIYSIVSMEICKPSLKWLDMDALTTFGPYIADLAPDDVDSSPKEKLGKVQIRHKFGPQDESQPRREVPRKISRLLQLGTLACHYYAAPELSPELSKKLLSELNNCDDYNNPRIKKLKEHLVNSVMSNVSGVEALRQLDSSITLLSPKQLKEIPANNLKEVLKNLGPTVKWTKGQLHTLVKKQLGDKKCEEVSFEELKALQSVAEGLPNCVLKRVRAQDILNDTEALKNISKLMRKGQLKAMLQGLHENVDLSELVQKLPSTLLRRVSLNNLAKANITSLDQLENKILSLPQAVYLARKMYNLKKLNYTRKLHSVLQGVTCKMFENLTDSETQDMAQAIRETPQWLSKMQAGCAARKLFASLEKKRADYFKTIIEKEMDEIPTDLLIHLPPAKVKDLPDSVCSVLLDKMEVANLSSLPLRAPSRLTLTHRALLCLARKDNETDFSRLTTQDVSRLGQLLCELGPSQLRLMAPDVLKYSLQALTSCQNIPRHHIADLIQLLNQTFGDPADWSGDAMETLGPLILLDNNATSALPNKPWMKNVLIFLKTRQSHSSDALRKKLFNLITTTASNAARKKRAANSNSNNGSTSVNKVPTVELIEELGMNNVYWTAAQLETMSESTFLATVEILGNIPDYSAEQLAVLSKKATKAFGTVSQMNETVVIQLGCITQGFSNANLACLPFLLDNLEEIAHCGWNESQLESVWRGVAKYNNLTAQQLGATEMVALNRFFCGLNSSEISRLNMEAFKNAVGSMDGVQCSFKVTGQLKTLAVSAFGDPKTWTEAQVSDLGNIVAAPDCLILSFSAGLTAAELASLEPAVFSFFSQSCIPLIPPRNFAALSVAQLEALGPDNAAMVTSEQRGVLSDKQLATLEGATAGSRTQAVTPPDSGAPSLSVEGISAFMKPLLFLLTGFLLL